MTIRSNITIRLPKIDKLRYIARLSNAAVIGISDSRVDKSITDSRVDKYITDSESIIVNDLLYFHRNRNEGGFACHIRNDFSYTQKNLFPNDTKNVFFEIHMPKNKPITVGIVY